MINFLFNKDGSIKELTINESIQQGNNNINRIFVYVDENDNDDFIYKANVEIPNGDIVELVGTASEETIKENTYKGYIFTLPNTVTLYPGIIYISFKIEDANSILFTYQIPLKVNKTTYVHQVNEEEQ